jgi:hypothetical protein
MEIALKVLVTLGVIPVMLFGVRMLVLAPSVAANVAADGTKGALNQVMRALHYLRNPGELKKVFIRDGEFTDKPVRLVSNSRHDPSDSDNQS